jgi:hypothetical protein
MSLLCVQLLRRDLHIDACSENEASLVDGCLNSLRRGSTKEAMLASELLSLVFLSLPEASESVGDVDGGVDNLCPCPQLQMPAISTRICDEDPLQCMLQLLEDVQPELQRTLTGNARVAAADALAIACFAAAGGEEPTLEAMMRMRRQWWRGDAKGRAATLRSW